MLKKIIREITRPFRRYFFNKLHENFNNSNIAISEKYTNIFSQSDQKIAILPIQWLDKQEENIKKIILPQKFGNSHPPKIFGQENPTFSKIVMPPVAIYKFETSIINIASSTIIYNKYAIVERIPGANPEICNFSSGFFLRHNLEHGLFATDIANSIIKNGIFLGGNGSENYYHWMIEILPKIQHIMSLSNTFDAYPYLLSEEVQNIPSFLESLNFLDSSRPRIYLKRNLSYHIDNLVYVSAINNLVFNVKEGVLLTPTHSFFRVDSILFIRSKFLNYTQSYAHNQKYPNKIFLARKNNRRQYNQDEIYGDIQQYGFSKIFMEEYTLAEQIYLFNQATHIIGPTGAAWTNVIFCNQTVKCLCWMSKEVGAFSAFSTLARICNINLEYIIYESKTNQLHADYYINPNLIRQWVQQEFQ